MTDTHELNDRLAREQAPAWRPNPGDTIVGQFAELKRITGSEYDDYPAVVLYVEGHGYVTVHAFHQTLKSGLAKLHSRGKLVQDEVLIIHYAGKQQSVNGRSYNLYVVLAGEEADAPVTEDAAALLFDGDE